MLFGILHLNSQEEGRLQVKVFETRVLVKSCISVETANREVFIEVTNYTFDQAKIQNGHLVRSTA